MTVRASRPWLVAAAAVLLASPAVAQPPASLRPRLFAVRDARVVTAPGRVLTKATVVIRDGVIEAVGPDAAAPPGALVIDGKGLTVYPGFVDACSHWGFDAGQRRTLGGPPATEDFASEALAATKPDNRKGVTPEFVTAAALQSADDTAANWRRLGFTARLAAPEGGLVVGQSVLVSLSGLPSRDTVLRSPVAMHAALRGVPGPDYPRSRMGEVAHVRQLFLDAGHYQRLWHAFEKSGKAGRQPPADAALAALGPVLKRELPVVFEADTADAIHRALDFAEEFELRPIILGGRHAWKVADRLKAQRVPVILRLAFSEPEPEREKLWPDRVKANRRKEEADEVANAAALHKAGVPIALSTAGQPGDRPWEKFRDGLRKAIAAGLPADAALAALTTGPAKVLGVPQLFGTVEPGRPANLVLTDGDFEAANTQVRGVFADGVRYEFEPDLKDPGKKDSVPARPAPPATAAPAADRDSELNADRRPATKTGGTVVIRNATVLTVTKGVIANAEIRVKDGKITYVGKTQDRPFDGTVIDAKGMFVMPGIIDTHSHFAVEGGVNEFSLSVVPEVRVRDVINSEDVQIYRGLAGGVTTARLLHGSANCIGGQDAVIKLKYGTSARDMLIAEAPRGVKFALGENVKRSDGRFPNTRLGVEAVLVRAFSEAQAYQKQWSDYRKARSTSKDAVAPRRDLRLEALADILSGSLKVHCHCYRSDEILMLLRVADRFGFKVQSLQHVLEGYKVAPEIAAHGAACSLFSDWWAYKIEAYDAIPHAAALLHQSGANVCLKSDSNELMRHLYQEAAKVVKYGGVGEDEVLKMITLNAAKQLGLEKRLGSIEVGKDADLVIFNGHPLNSYSRVEMTLVEGEVYFQRAEKPAPAEFAKAGPEKPAAGFKKIEPNDAQRYVLQGVTLHPATGPAVPNATVVVEKGKIASVEANGGRAANGPTLNMPGVHVYPGLIDAGTVLGLTELGSAKETQDFSEGGDFQPDLRASTGINPDSELIPVTRANGVTTVVTRPMGGLLAGQSALINLAGWTPKEMALVDPLALHIDFPADTSPLFGNPDVAFGGRAVVKKQREEKVRRLKELFRQALAYDDARQAAPGTPVNPRLDALVPYARGQKPVVIQAYRQAEILDALKLADEMKWKLILSGATDAWKVAGELKKRDVPVILGPVMVLPSESHDPFDAPFTNAAKLHRAGVRFCIRSSGSSNARNLPYEAAMAVSYGLPPEEGLKAVTLYPAQILGVADQLGSISAGKRANLVLTNGDILQASTQVLGLFIDGKPLAPENKQTRLYERYRERLREVQQGKAPLGTR